MPLGNRFQVFQSIGTVSELINSFINPCSCWQCTLISDQQCHTCVSSVAIKKESLQGRRMITKHCFMKTDDSRVSCNVCNIINTSNIRNMGFTSRSVMYLMCTTSAIATVSQPSSSSMQMCNKNFI